jgi:hypothetical protein
MILSKTNLKNAFNLTSINIQIKRKMFRNTTGVEKKFTLFL